MPGANEKITSLRQSISAGGPATNAAVTCAYLGRPTTLLTGVGKHSLAEGIRADLARFKVRLIDADEGRHEPPALSTILVTSASGDRAVVSPNAAGQPVSAPANLDKLVAGSRILLVDGHHPGLALPALRAARLLGIPTVLDGGSWKPHTPDLLPYVDIAVCSANFHPPGAFDSQDTLAFLRSAGVTWTAVTQGADDIIWTGPVGGGAIAVPAIPRVVDTLGAGDIFHGALTCRLAEQEDIDHIVFTEALADAAAVAALACQSFGTRGWLDQPIG
jgi:sugar/nucleoside kinase (ribokinase family)